MNRPARTGASAPVYEADFYADESILDPQPHDAAMRELGPITRHDLCLQPSSFETFALLRANPQDEVRGEA